MLTEVSTADLQRDHKIRSLYPEVFSSIEEATGEADKDSGIESPYGNVIRFLTENPT